MKNTFIPVLLFCFSITSLFAQTTHIDDLVDHWTYFKSGSTSYYQDVCQSYHLQFRKGGKGILSISVTYLLEGESARVYNGVAPFAYHVSEETEIEASKLFLDLQFGELSFRTYTSSPRRALLVDKSLLDQLRAGISNSKTHYGVQVNGGSLIIEGFEWNDSSVFTYFENEPGNSSCTDY